MAQPIRRWFLQTGLAAAAFSNGGAHAQPSSDFDGEWTGVLAAGAARLRLRLEIGPGLTARMISIDQGGASFPAGEVAIDRESIAIAFPAVRGRYVGRRDGDVIAGTWTQGSDLPLRFLRGEAGLVDAAPAVALTARGLGALLARSGAPAMAAAARGPDGRMLDLAQGRRRIDAEDAVTTEDLWHVGSITKSMTATLAAKLGEQGVLSLEARLSEVLAEIAPEMNPAYHGVTLKHLLCHRSGLPANLAALAFYPRHEADPRASRLRYVRAALASAPVGPSGETFVYSNSGYVVAGVIMEQALGMPWETIIAEALFAPLGLTSAGQGAAGTPGRADQPWGHGEDPSGLRGFGPGDGINDNSAVLGPAGRVHMSLSDLCRYAQAHKDRNPFLSAQSWQALHTPPFGGDYALGLVVRPDGSLWHNGSNTVFYAEMAIDRAKGVVGASACNSGALAQAQGPVGEALAGAMAAVA